MMSLTAIDGFTDKLIQLWDTMPEALQFTEAWLQQNEQLPEWPLDVISASKFTVLPKLSGPLLKRPRSLRQNSVFLYPAQSTAS
jgi:hypothetical protein